MFLRILLGIFRRGVWIHQIILIFGFAGLGLGLFYGNHLIDAQRDTIIPSIVDNVYVLSDGSQLTGREIFHSAYINYIQQHLEKYPDCQEDKAIQADAIHHAVWFLEYLEHTKILGTLDGEQRQLDSQVEGFILRDLSAFENDSDGVSPAEIQMWQEKSWDLKKRQWQAFRQQKPLYPKPNHMH